jgi:hypothetical protein
MTTPQQRLARMRKYFEKNKSVLTEDYKFFITPDKPAKQPESSQMGNPVNVSQPDKHGIKAPAGAVTLAEMLETISARAPPSPCLPS